MQTYRIVLRDYPFVSFFYSMLLISKSEIRRITGGCPSNCFSHGRQLNSYEMAGLCKKLFDREPRSSFIGERLDLIIDDAKKFLDSLK